MEIPGLVRLRSTQILLLWSAIICFAFYHIHERTLLLPILLRFVIGAVVGLVLVTLCHLSYWRRERIRKQREAYARLMTSLEKEDLFKLLPENIAETAAIKRPDQLDWLNLELAKAWPFLNEALSDVVREKLQPVLDQYKMGMFAEMTIPSMNFGVASPCFLGVKMEEMGEDEASVEADLHWKADREKIVVRVRTVGPNFKVKVQNISISGTVKIVLKPLTDTMPCFGAILVSLRDIPVIDFDVKIADGDANALPGVERMIDYSIRTAIEDMLVWPCRIVCPVLPGDYSFLELKPVGILDVFLLKAEGVMNTDILGKSDCFVILYVRKKPDRIKRSTTKKNSLNPVWNEGFKIEVDDPQYQNLIVQLMDEESVSSAEYIGRGTVPLKDLEPHKPKEMWLDMVESEGLPCKKPRARLHIILLYEPFKDESSLTGAQENVASDDVGRRAESGSVDPSMKDQELLREEGHQQNNPLSVDLSVKDPELLRKEEIDHKGNHDLNIKQTT